MVAPSRECREPYRCPSSGIADHATQGHQEYAKSLSGVCERVIGEIIFGGGDARMHLEVLSSP